ncbi:MAG: thioredoxin [Planctomycetota bacterium]|nr:MAG: thioredoxin [Planctomycetota bacterium]
MCRKVVPQVEAQVQKSQNLILYKINIKNWKSPVVKKYNITTIPYILLYNPQKKLIQKGSQALNTIRHWQDELP